MHAFLLPVGRLCLLTLCVMRLHGAPLVHCPHVEVSTCEFTVDSAYLGYNEHSPRIVDMCFLLLCETLTLVAVEPVI